MDNAVVAFFHELAHREYFWSHFDPVAYTTKGWNVVEDERYAIREGLRKLLERDLVSPLRTALTMLISALKNGPPAEYHAAAFESLKTDAEFLALIGKCVQRLEEHDKRVGIAAKA